MLRTAICASPAQRQNEAVSSSAPLSVQYHISEDARPSLVGPERIEGRDGSRADFERRKEKHGRYRGWHQREKCPYNGHFCTLLTLGECLQVQAALRVRNGIFTHEQVTRA